MNGKCRIVWLLAAVLTAACFDAQSAPYNEDILGIWEMHYTESISGTGYLKVQGTSEFFRNGSTNEVGLYTIESVEQGSSTAITYAVISSGEWLIHGDRVTLKTNDVKSFPIIVKQDGNQLDLRAQPISVQSEIIAQIPKLEDLIPKGLSVEARIVTITQDRLVLSVDEGGDPLDLVGRRVSKHMLLDKAPE